MSDNTHYTLLEAERQFINKKHEILDEQILEFVYEMGFKSLEDLRDSGHELIYETTDSSLENSKYILKLVYVRKTKEINFEYTINGKPIIKYLPDYAHAGKVIPSLVNYIKD